MLRERTSGKVGTQSVDSDEDSTFVPFDLAGVTAFPFPQVTPKLPLPYLYIIQFLCKPVDVEMPQCMTVQRATELKSSVNVGHGNTN